MSSDLATIDLFSRLDALEIRFSELEARQRELKAMIEEQSLENKDHGRTLDLINGQLERISLKFTNK